jgi:hypothetical protein
MKLSELLPVAYRFHPRGVHPGSLAYRDTSEYGRQLAALRVARAEYPRWAAMTRRLGDRFSLENRSLCLLSDGFFDSAYQALVFYASQGEEYALGFCVSILGPYYVVHRLSRPGEEPCAQAVTEEIEATYRGYQPIPPEIGDVIVPDIVVSGKRPGTATIYDCLLSVDGGDSRTMEPWSCPPVESPRPARARKGPETFRFRLVPGRSER